MREPWPASGKLRAWSGGLYSLLACTRYVEAEVVALYEAMAVDGVNAERNFAFYADAGTAWAGTGLFPWRDDWSWNEDYWTLVDRRLAAWCGARGGTEIVAILDACSMYEDSSWLANPLNKLAAKPAEVYWPGPARDKVIAFAVEFVKRFGPKYGDRLVIETRNEGEQIVWYDALQSFDDAMIAALNAANWPDSRIQIEWYDSSMYYDTLSSPDHLDGAGLAATHRCVTPHDVDWYANSPGKQGLMRLGDYPCTDGPTFGADETPQVVAHGLTFAWLVGTAAEDIARRPNADEIARMVVTMRDLGYERFEMLSAAGFQRGDGPAHLGDALTLGRAERTALVR